MSVLAHYKPLPGDQPDPHEPGIIWYLNEAWDIVYFAPPYQGWKLLNSWPLPATPERIALWTALRLEGRRRG